MTLQCDDAANTLLTLLHAAADGRFPPVDGCVTYLAPPAAHLEAVVAFTGHAVICSRFSESDLSDLHPDGYGHASHPDVLQRMAGTERIIGVLDAILVRRAVGGNPLPRRTDLDAHSRVVHARSIRTNVSVYGDERGLITLGAGLAGRRELSIEVSTGGQGRGWGPTLLRDGLATAPIGELVFAAVSPGNARSLRMFLSAGFQPIGSEVILHRR